MLILREPFGADNLARAGAARRLIPGDGVRCIPVGTFAPGATGSLRRPTR
jgi:hypothetical protein